MSLVASLAFVLGISAAGVIAGVDRETPDSPLIEGARIRFWTPLIEKNPSIAEIKSVRTDEMVVVIEGLEGRYKVRFQDLERIELSTKRAHSRIAWCAAIGAVVVGISAAGLNEGIKNSAETGPSSAALFGGALVGGAVGALLGWALSTGEQWEEVPNTYYGGDLDRVGPPGSALILRISF